MDLVSRAIVKTSHDKGVENLSEIVMNTPNASGSMFVYDEDYDTDNIPILDYDGYAYADTRNPAMIGQSLTYLLHVLHGCVTDVRYPYGDYACKVGRRVDV